MSELFGSLPDLSRRRADGFTNRGGETLFHAVRATAVDWDGATGCGTCDLSAVILADFGHYESRDRLIAEFGQTLCRPARALADPLLSRRQACDPTSPAARGGAAQPDPGYQSPVWYLSKANWSTSTKPVWPSRSRSLNAHRAGLLIRPVSQRRHEPSERYHSHSITMSW